TYLIVADGQENIGLIGQGAVQGVGKEDLGRRGPEVPDNTSFRFGTMHLSNCKNVHVSDVRLLYSDWYAVSMSRCERVFFDRVSILNNFFRTNTDGIDPTSCKDVFISNCDIVAGDDCICPKTSKGDPLENLVVSNCVLESVSSAIKLGTGSDGDFRDIKVS